MPLGFEGCRPSGTIENSPTFQRVSTLGSEVVMDKSRRDDRKRLNQPFLRNLRCLGHIPSVKTLGYSQASLQDATSKS